MKISIIYVNYYSSEYLIRSINSIVEKIKNIDYEFIIINNSIDDQIEINNSLNKITTVINSENNIGFGSANNEAVKYAKYDYLMFINPDTEITVDFIAPIIQFIANNKGAAICSPGLVYGNLKYQNSTGFNYGLIFDMMEALWIMPAYRAAVKIYYKYSRKEIFETGWISAACMIIKKETFDKLKGFDENIYLNYEDIDICLRAVKAGFKNYYFKGFRCIHYDHKSFGRNYEKLITTRYKSKFYLSGKYFGKTGYFISRLVNIAGILMKYFLLLPLFPVKSAKSKRSGYLKSLLLYTNGY